MSLFAYFFLTTFIKPETMLIIRIQIESSDFDLKKMGHNKFWKKIVCNKYNIVSIVAKHACIMSKQVERLIPIRINQNSTSAISFTFVIDTDKQLFEKCCQLFGQAIQSGDVSRVNLYIFSIDFVLFCCFVLLWCFNCHFL